MPSRLKWFGVKRFLRTEAVGPVRRRDADYDPDGTLVEERIVVIRARDSRDAADRAGRLLLKEGIKYRNAYGQMVRTRVLKPWSTYELFDPPSDGAEVFSDTRRIAASVSDAQLVPKLAKARLSLAAQKRRRRFLATEIAHGLDAIWNRRRPTGR